MSITNIFYLSETSKDANKYKEVILLAKHEEGSGQVHDQVQRILIGKGGM